MADGKLLVIIIRTPNSDRYLPIETMLKNDKRFEIEYIEASMTPTYHDVRSKNIAYSTEIFEYFHGRKLTPAEIGCADSHNNARQIIQNQSDGGIIVEDDARIINVDTFFEMASKFLLSQNFNQSILNLTGFRQIGLEHSSNELPKNNRYIKLWGSPDLAVSYALTKKAAIELLKSNQPIMNVSDWPATECKYFVPLIPIVHHGDFITSSLIDSTESNFRNDKTFSKKLLKFTLIEFINNKPNDVKISDLIRFVYVKSFKWRLDYIKVKLKLGFIN